MQIPRAPLPPTDLDRKVENLRATLRKAIEANIREPSEAHAALASDALAAYRREVEIREKVRVAEKEALGHGVGQPVRPPAPRPCAPAQDRPQQVSGPGVPRHAWKVYAGVCAALVALGAALEVFWR